MTILHGPDDIATLPQFAAGDDQPAVSPQPAPNPDPGTAVENEPALTKTGIAGVIGAVLLLVIARVNRSWDFLNVSELDQAKALIALIAPFIAGYLIRRQVVPTARANAAATFFHAVGYTQGLDANAGVEPVVPDHVVAEIKAQGVAEAKAETARRRAETRAANQASKTVRRGRSR